MSARDLLHELESSGITVAANAGMLYVRPASRLTASYRQALRDAKPEVLNLLARCGDSGYLEALEERAAIMEFDGGICRREAEAAAQQLIHRIRSQAIGG